MNDNLEFLYERKRERAMTEVEKQKSVLKDRKSEKLKSKLKEGDMTDLRTKEVKFDTMKGRTKKPETTAEYGVEDANATSTPTPTQNPKDDKATNLKKRILSNWDEDDGAGVDDLSKSRWFERDIFKVLQSRKMVKSEKGPKRSQEELMAAFDGEKGSESEGEGVEGAGEEAGSDVAVSEGLTDYEEPDSDYADDGEDEYADILGGKQMPGAIQDKKALQMARKVKGIEEPNAKVSFCGLWVVIFFRRMIRLRMMITRGSMTCMSPKRIRRSGRTSGARRKNAPSGLTRRRRKIWAKKASSSRQRSPSSRRRTWMILRRMTWQRPWPWREK
jgi:hypothetical protein